MTTQWATMAEMAERLGLSIGKFKEMLQDGAIPRDAYFQHGRTYRFHVDRVENGLLGETSGEQLEFDFGSEEGSEQ